MIHVDYIYTLYSYYPNVYMLYFLSYNFSSINDEDKYVLLYILQTVLFIYYLQF
jgi:hypothetical protein